MRLGRAFFERDTVEVARALLGQRLVSNVGGTKVAGIVLECEAYVRGDSANHARRGRTARNASMFTQAGVAYVYFTYGMHYCMNVVTEGEGSGTAVLIRALEPLEGIEVMGVRRRAGLGIRELCRGPARLCVAMGIDRGLDGVDTCAPDAMIYLELGSIVSPDRISAGPRVGVSGTEQDVSASLRFYLTDSPYVSVGPRKVKPL